MCNLLASEHTVRKIVKFGHFEHFGLSKKAAVVSNFCLIGKMIELDYKTFMPIQTSDILQPFTEPCDVESVADFSTEFQRGWLTSESIVQLKLFGDNSLNIWKSKFEGQQLCVKVSSSEDSQNWSVFEVAVSLVFILCLASGSRARL